MERIMVLSGHFSYAGLFGLLILGCFGFPFPEDAILIICGFLMASGDVQPLAALLVIYAGLLIGDFLIYYAGRRYGRLIVTHRWFRKVLTPGRLDLLEKKFDRYGMWLILVGRHLIGLRAQIFLAAGAVRMSPGRFIAADAVSSLVTMGVMVGFGYLGGAGLKAVVKDVRTVEYWLLALFAGAVIVCLAVRYLRGRRRMALKTPIPLPVKPAVPLAAEGPGRRPPEIQLDDAA